MPPTLIGQTSFTSDAASIAVPAGGIAGDVLRLFLLARAPNSVAIGITLPAGWVKATGYISNAGDGLGAASPVTAKKFFAGETSVTLVHSSGAVDIQEAVLQLWRGVNGFFQGSGSGSTIFDTPIQSNTGSGSIVTNIDAGALGLSVGMVLLNGTVIASSNAVPLGWTNAYLSGARMRIDYKVMGAPGTEPSPEYEFTPDAYFYYGSNVMGPSEPPAVSYNCTESGCVDPGTGLGEFATLEECEAVCIPISYNCVDGVCVDPGDGSGEFATLEECEMSGCGAPTFIGTTERFDSGDGSEWYIVPQLSDSGDELRSKVIKAVRATGRLTNASAMIFGYDVGQRIIMSDLENGVRNPVQMVTRPQTFPDTTEVAQTARKPINIINAVLHTVRISGDDRGKAVRDRLDEAVYEIGRQGVRR